MKRLNPIRRDLRANLLYFGILVWRFRITFLLLFILLFGTTGILFLFYTPDGEALTWPQAVGAAYFLMLGQPSGELPETLSLELLFIVVPPISVLAVADGVVRFAYLFFSKHRSDKEWFAVLSQTLHDHVIVCGAGRVGYRVLEQLTRLGVAVVFIERKEDAAFVGTIRDLGVPLFVDDVRGHQALEKANVRKARAVVCATDDDLANLNIAIDARRLNPDIRVVMRLFDDDLVTKMKESLKVEAFSTSALAAPALAVAALDPCIRTSFEVGSVLMVVWDLTVTGNFVGRSVASLRDELGVFVLDVARPGASDVVEPRGSTVLNAGDRVTLQAPLAAYEGLRDGLSRGRRP